ncbi:Vesicle-associated membrane protein-associated protein [Trichinella spiralis]|uniref:Major sperm protein n=2 Tax=Trichinella spiralis TaxID=6334 RepID=A0ABR3KPG2_TRISP
MDEYDERKILSAVKLSVKGVLIEPSYKRDRYTEIQLANESNYKVAYKFCSPRPNQLSIVPPYGIVEANAITVANVQLRKLIQPAWIPSDDIMSIHFAVVPPGITEGNASHFWKYPPKITVRHTLQVYYSPDIEDELPEEEKYKDDEELNKMMMQNDRFWPTETAQSQ